MFELLTNDAKQWLQVLRDFDGTRSSVAQNVAALKKIAASSAYPYSVRNDAAQLMNKGLEAKAKLDSLAATRDTVVGWLRQVIPGSSSQLGFLPLVYVGVGIAAFATAVALANKFLSGSASFAKQISAYQQEQQRLVEQGVDPTRAAELARQATQSVADSSDRPGTFEKLGKNALYIGGGVILVAIVLPRVLDHFSRRR